MQAPGRPAVTSRQHFKILHIDLNIKNRPLAQLLSAHAIGGGGLGLNSRAG